MVVDAEMVRPDVAVALARLPQGVRGGAVDRVELVGDERNPGEREVAEQNAGDGDHLELLLDHVATSGVRTATERQAHVRHRYHLRMHHVTSSDQR